MGAHSPGNDFLILIVVSLLGLWRGALTFARACLAISVVGLTFLAVFPLGDLVLRPLETQYPSAPVLDGVAGIIVLGGGESTDQSAHWDQPLVNEAGDRYIAAIHLAYRYPEALLLFTGGSGQLRRADLQEASIAAQIFFGAGLSEDRLLLEHEARNTAENARRSLALRESDAKGTRGAWVLVTSASHMPRAVASFCAAGWTDLVPWPTDYRTARFSQGIGWDLANHLDDLNRGIKEWVGLFAYRILGHASTSENDTCLYQ